MLRIYDFTQTEFGTLNSENIYSESLRTTHDGKLGTTDDVLIYVHNTDPTKYYVSVQLSPSSLQYDDTVGEWAFTGFGLKCIYGERQPTETEWDQVKNGETIVLPNIGSNEAADTANYYPIWTRTIVPGKTGAINKVDMAFDLSSRERVVGS
jgi:hypothetical protein